MSTKEKLMVKSNTLLRNRGVDGLRLAQKTVFNEKVSSEPLRKAIDYFIGEIWFDFLHPALLSLASEAIGGDAKDTEKVGAAFVLLAGGADIHDDIIDQSETKNGKLTVFGKFGKDIAILAGDALLFQGLYLLHEAVDPLTEESKRLILESVKTAFWGISSAEAKEANYRNFTEVSGQEFFDTVKDKVAVAEATARVGAVLGGGTPQEVKLLSEFGRILGLLNTIRDEYIDVFDAEELRNRAEKECLPLPILLTFRNLGKKTAILKLLEQPLTDKVMEEILDLTMDSDETRKLTEELKRIMTNEISQIANVKKNQKELTLLLNASVEDL
jgi:geranylgeranyl pyrophosphate synthase